MFRSHATRRLVNLNNMKLSIFIKTYGRDKEWLRYCLKSIRKFVTGHNQVVIACDARDMQIVQPLITTEKLVPCGDPPENQGYIHQQMVKMQPDNFGCFDCDYVVHMDSDCVATQPCDLAPALFTNGRPVYLITPYSVIGNDVPWKPITEKAVGFPVEFEYMRRMPMVYPIAMYSKIRVMLEQLHGVTVDQYAYGQPHRAFSEFNVMGALAHRHFPDEFEWHNTAEKPPPPSIMEQHWSWGGVTSAVRARFDSFL